MKLNILIIIIFSFSHFAANAQWSIKNLDENSQKSSIIKFKNDSLGFSMGCNSSFLKTDDIGETWQEIQLGIIVNIKDFQFISDSSIFAVGDYYTGNGENMTSKLIKSENLGETWDSIANFQGKQLRSLHFFSNDSGIVAGYDGIYRTINSGISWDTVWSIKEYGYKYGEITQLSFQTQVGYAIGIGRNQNNNPNFDYFVLKSNNAGLSWEKIKTFPNSLASVQFLNKDTGFVGTESSTIYKTIDGGNNWAETQITQNSNSIKSIQFISDLTGFATGHPSAFILEAPTSFFISKTLDGGETWASYDTIGITLNSIHFLSDTVGFVSGHFNLIMKSNGKIDKLPENYPWHLVEDPTGINDSNFPESQIKIYPNPTNGILFIKNLNLNKEIKNISLINISGQTIVRKTVSNDKLVQLDLTDLLSGIYLIRIGYLDKTETMKIIKK